MSETIWRSAPPVLRSKRKSTAVCPFTQWYCTRECALARRMGEKYWTCSLCSETRFISYVGEGEDA